MPKTALVLPYFGELPTYAQLFFRSVSANPDYSLILATDARLDAYQIPPNVTVIPFSFDMMRERLHRLLGPSAHLANPYKLCDYKPLYGLLFERELSGYDVWGYSDADMLWGRLNSFIPPSLLEDYDKAFVFGHFSLHRNCAQVNELPLRRRDASCGLDMAMSTDLICYYDEVGAWEAARLDGLRVWTRADMADITPASYRMTLADVCTRDNVAGQRFVWDEGRVIRRNPMADGRDMGSSSNDDEFMYIHLQKRRMVVRVDPFADDVWEIRENGFFRPDAPQQSRFSCATQGMLHRGRFQLSRLARISPERVALSARIKRLRNILWSQL